jgi:cytochrome c peroxidase
MWIRHSWIGLLWILTGCGADSDKGTAMSSLSQSSMQSSMSSITTSQSSTSSSQPSTSSSQSSASQSSAPSSQSSTSSFQSSTSSASSQGIVLPEATLERLRQLSPTQFPAVPPDSTNVYADNPDAIALGQKFFFDTRFSGQLLDSDNGGSPDTLGLMGETGKVSCESCHNAEAGFLDVRSPRAQISLAAGWTRRRTPSLLNIGHARTFNWDGRRDTLYNQVFGVIESPLEFNSSLLFVAQQIQRYYKPEYEALFGPFPEGLSDYPILSADAAGCSQLPEGNTPEGCVKTGNEDPAVISVIVNFGKALGAYQRQLTCGTSRFDQWMQGDSTALTTDEQKGAALFINKNCDSCHSGPLMSDQGFYNVGVANLVNSFGAAFDDPGALVGIAAIHQDKLNSRGSYSDGDDGRLSLLPQDVQALEGTFKTPSLRCVSRRPSFFHAGQKRSLDDVVIFFNQGGNSQGFRGIKDSRMVPLGMNREEREQLLAFLRALDGPGPDSEFIEKP